jgi:hypothetical protein
MFRRIAPALLVAVAAVAGPVLAQDVPASGPPPFDTRTTRLFIVPTARSLPRGHGAVGLTEIYFPWAEYGIRDRLSISAFPILPLPDLTDGGAILGAKYQVVDMPKFQAAAGVYHAMTRYDSGGFLYGVGTFGGDRAAVTAGYGYAYGAMGDDFGEANSIVFLGADVALNRNVRLMVEGYTGSVEDLAMMTGVRFTLGRFSIDAGIVTPFYESGAGGVFPVGSIAWSF